jgi:hypothetical protein
VASIFDVDDRNAAFEKFYLRGLAVSTKIDNQKVSCEQLIWQNNPHALREQPLESPASWAGAVQHDLVTFGMDANLKTSMEPRPAYLSAAVIMMVKDEADIIGENLIWLHHIGLRRFILLDNDSTDATASIIERFRTKYQDVELLVLKDPLVRYMQAEKTTGLYRLAISIWPDIKWVIPADADEFLIAERGLQVLEEINAGVDVISIPKVIHFRRPQASHGRSAMELLDYTVMELMDYRSPLFIVPPKVIVKHNLFMTISQGNHSVRLVDDRPPVYVGGFGFGLYYREFPTRSFDHFKKKIMNGGPAIKAAEDFLGRKVGGEHWIAYHDALQNGGEALLREIYQREWIRESTPGFVVDDFNVNAEALR